MRRNQISSFARNGQVHLNRRGGCQFSRLLTAEVCASAVVMLDTPCSEVVWRVLAIHCVRQFPLHFTFRASSCAISFQLESTNTHLNNSKQGVPSIDVQKFGVEHFKYERKTIENQNSIQEEMKSSLKSGIASVQNVLSSSLLSKTWSLIYTKL